MEQEMKSKYLLAKEYQLPNIDEIYAAGLLPLDKNPLIGMLAGGKKLPGSEKITITGVDGNSIDLYIWKPTKLTRQGALPIVYFIHGGGYVIGDANTMLTPPDVMTNELQAILVSVEYRIATVAPFPADIHDCYSGLEYVYDHAAELGGDPKRIVITGESAGGGLAARLALYNRDKGRVPLSGEALSYPMLDCRTATADDQMPNPYAGEFLWTPAYNRLGWSTLLGGKTLTEEEMPYYSAALAKNVENLPPTFIIVGSLDLFCMASMTYAQRLICAGVSTELHVIPGVMHAFEGVVPGSPQAKLYMQLRLSAIKRMFGDFE